MKFLIYKAKDGWRWRAVASNGKVKADSGEAYTRRRTARKELAKFLIDAATAEVIEQKAAK